LEPKAHRYIFDGNALSATDSRSHPCLLPRGELVAAALATPAAGCGNKECSLTLFLDRGLQTASASKPPKAERLTCGIVYS